MFSDSDREELPAIGVKQDFPQNKEWMDEEGIFQLRPGVDAPLRGACSRPGGRRETWQHQHQHLSHNNIRSCIYSGQKNSPGLDVWKEQSDTAWTKVELWPLDPVVTGPLDLVGTGPLGGLLVCCSAEQLVWWVLCSQSVRCCRHCWTAATIWKTQYSTGTKHGLAADQTAPYTSDEQRGCYGGAFHFKVL